MYWGKAIGINNLGEIVGVFIDASGKGHGYLLSKGVFTTIDFPGAFSLTQPQGINSKGEIVGFYDDSNGQLHGFRLAAGIFSTVDVPKAFDTEAAGVNEAGQIVGIYHQSGVHAFSKATADRLWPGITYHMAMLRQMTQWHSFRIADNPVSARPSTNSVSGQPFVWPTIRQLLILIRTTTLRCGPSAIFLNSFIT